MARPYHEPPCYLSDIVPSESCLDSPLMYEGLEMCELSILEMGSVKFRKKWFSPFGLLEDLQSFV